METLVNDLTIQNPVVTDIGLKRETLKVVSSICVGCPRLIKTALPDGPTRIAAVMLHLLTHAVQSWLSSQVHCCGSEGGNLCTELQSEIVDSDG
ncbi:unnamed protein product [Protopolystoma xenopodis]|uniref:Uncharacterized protein n=1 Tax=Protopolystoma xenopodis TaxID=117903 RepID=A0A448XFD4_9PLAT|nr:unnamed protein product [Protopolystoma xenopodis]